MGAVDASEAAKVEKERDWRHKYTKCVHPSITLAWLLEGREDGGMAGEYLGGRLV